MFGLSWSKLAMMLEQALFRNGSSGFENILEPCQARSKSWTYVSDTALRWELAVHYVEVQSVTIQSKLSQRCHCQWQCRKHWYYKRANSTEPWPRHLLESSKAAFQALPTEEHSMTRLWVGIDNIMSKIINVNVICVGSWAAESRTRSTVLWNLAIHSYQIALLPSKLNSHAESDSRAVNAAVIDNVQQVLEIRLCSVDGVALCQHSPKVDPRPFKVSHAVVWKIILLTS